MSKTNDRAATEAAARLLDTLRRAGNQQVAELHPTDAAQRLFPLLQEYAGKLTALCERCSQVLVRWVTGSEPLKGVAALEAGTAICLHDTLQKPVTELAREASGLLEHAPLEHYLQTELKLRLDELEESLRGAGLLVGELVLHLTSRKEHADRVRKLIEKSGRYEAPF